MNHYTRTGTVLDLNFNRPQRTRRPTITGRYTRGSRVMRHVSGLPVQRRAKLKGFFFPRGMTSDGKPVSVAGVVREKYSAGRGSRRKMGLRSFGLVAPLSGNVGRSVSCLFGEGQGARKCCLLYATYRKRLRTRVVHCGRLHVINGVLGPGASRQLHGIVSVRCGTRQTPAHDHRGELSARRDPPRTASTSPPVRDPLSLHRRTTRTF